MTSDDGRRGAPLTCRFLLLTSTVSPSTMVKCPMPALLGMQVWNNSVE